ncbi:hypothetical protein [Parendozoicomonas haliclonae]|uniref:Styrene-oxide isomerase n=1 Tax=Parendozoicomonas haliclonae TaxID=1960125 RepID=A0A1X7AM84_9GAMM|nr:hypothetical protein [Parendozoicomonas haliclonae]SMA49040.1 hypothetical protein EHSB41UT_03014 [Parendozoicomonas haliclonae]
MSGQEAIYKQQLRAVIHGSLGIFLGLLAGVALTYSALGEIAIWPWVSIPVDMPGDVSLWRAAHVGSITNGLLCIALPLAFGVVKADGVSARRVCNALIFTVWGNIIFYFARIWGTNRGLALESERFGEGNFFDGLAMWPAFAAMLVTAYAVIKMILLARQALKLGGVSHD